MVLNQYYCAVTCESSVRFDLLLTSSCRRVWIALPHGSASERVRVFPRQLFGRIATSPEGAAEVSAMLYKGVPA